MTFPQRRGGHLVAMSFVLLLGIAGSAIGRDLSSPPSIDDSTLDRHSYYTNVDGDSVHQPAKSLNGNVPRGASALCRDGDYSFSEHHTGTCSRHGGVAQWLH
jgi:hypothetical protein